jgi:hypothetical protein
MVEDVEGVESRNCGARGLAVPPPALKYPATPKIGVVAPVTSAAHGRSMHANKNGLASEPATVDRNNRAMDIVGSTGG